MLNLSDCNEIEQTSYNNEMIRTTILTDGKTLSSFGVKSSVKRCASLEWRVQNFTPVCECSGVFSTI